MTVVEQSKIKISWLSVIVLALLCVIFQVPYLSRNVSAVIVLGMMAIYLLSVSNLLPSMANWQKNTIYAVCLFVAAEAVYKVLDVSSASVDYYFATIKFLFLLCAMLPIFQGLSRKQKLFLSIVSTATLLYCIVDNIFLSQLYLPDYFATLATRPEGIQTNAADTAFSGAVMFFFGMAVCWVLHASNWRQRLTAIVLIAVSLVFLFTAGQRGIIFILSLVMILLLLVHNSKIRQAKWLWSVIIAVVVIVLLTTDLYKTILYGIVDLLGADRLSVRVDRIIMLFESGSVEEAGGSMQGRFELIGRSLETFTSSVPRFLFGVGDHRANRELVGNHSQFIDMLARYGILGTAVFGMMLSCVCKAVLRMAGVYEDLRLRSQLKVILFIFILRGMLGNVMIGSIGVQIFVLIPLVFSMLTRQEAMKDA